MRLGPCFKGERACRPPLADRLCDLLRISKVPKISIQYRRGSPLTSPRCPKKEAARSLALLADHTSPPSVLAHCVDSSDSNMASTALCGVADSWELASLHPIQPRPLRTPSRVWSGPIWRGSSNGRKKDVVIPDEPGHPPPCSGQADSLTCESMPAVAAAVHRYAARHA